MKNKELLTKQTILNTLKSSTDLIKLTLWLVQIDITVFEIVFQYDREKGANSCKFFRDFVRLCMFKG